MFVALLITVDKPLQKNHFFAIFIEEIFLGLSQVLNSNNHNDDTNNNN